MKPINPFLKVSEIQLNSIYLPLQICLNECSSSVAEINRRFADSQNLVRKIQHVASLAIVFVAHAFKIAGSFLVTTCFFLSRLKKMQAWERNGSSQDISLLSAEEIEYIRPQILQDLSDVMHKNATEIEKSSAYNQILSYYARSGKVYGPVLRLWVDHLLKEAHQSKSSIIFLARDGIAPYEVAKNLLKDSEYSEMYPELCQNNKISLAFLSRKVIRSLSGSCKDPLLGVDYIKQLLPEDLYGEENLATLTSKVMFVDIGFAGSMIEEIKTIMSKATGSSFEDKCSFHYLISHTEKASGFLGCLKKPLDDVKSAGKNPAVYWLEDSHQTSLKSPQFLVRHDDGKVYADTVIPGHEQYTNTHEPLQRLLRDYSTRAAIYFATKATVKLEEQHSALTHFKNTLAEINQTKLPLFIRHI